MGVHARVQGPKSGGGSPHGGQRVPRVGVRIHMGSIRQPWLGASIVIGNSSYVYKSASKSSHKGPESPWESQGMREVKVKDPKSGGILGVRSYRGRC